MGFEGLGLSPMIMETIRSKGFESPTVIQEKSLPAVLEGKDVIGESATGSGKTLAFGCGIVENLSPGNGIQSLVLTPTRELAEQVKGALREISQKKMRVTAVYGGVSIDPQIQALSKADVVVATPGRLLDHMERGTIDLTRVRILVLDEVDRMLDMGFIEDVEKIISQCPEERQTMFFSATVSEEIKELSSKYMKDPVNVSVMNQVDPSKLKQIYYDVPRNMKLSLLVHLLRGDKSGLSMVFCNTRKTTDFVVKNLNSNGIKALSIHGGMTQNKRTKMINSFISTGRGVLVCTDVAARGLHIDNVSHVYNYDIPKDPKDYVHRIGRTARAGEEGMAVNLLCDYDHENFTRLLEVYGDFNIKNVEKPYIKRVLAAKEGSYDSKGPGRRGFGRKGPGVRDSWKRGPGNRNQGMRSKGGKGPGSGNHRGHGLGSREGEVGRRFDS
ncbi:MAG: DEAD/DEAH box helicase [Candidatus Woesearchaeota archaeon]